MKCLSLVTIALIALGSVSPLLAAPIVVSSFDASYTAPGQWYISSQQGGATAGVVSLVGQGGNLESNSPLGTGAALLTTPLADSSGKVEVSVSNAYGTAASVLPTLSLSYSYNRDNLPTGNTAAAPAIKLTFLGTSTAGDNDGYITLVYEPYLNLSGDPTSDAWTTVNIDFESGLFWQTGGFGQTNSAGGLPLKTLEEWLSLMGPNGFDNANLQTVTIGVGTFNQGQIGYFDNVSINGTTYDFELAAAEVPEPASLAVWGLVSIAGATYGWRKRRRASAAS